MIPQIQGEEGNMANWQPFGTYTGPTVASFTDPQNIGFGMTTNAATGGGSDVPDANNALKAFDTGSFLSAGNPYFGAMANSVAQSVLPSLDSQWESSGRFSGNEEAPQAISKGLTAAIAPYAYQNYQQGLTDMLQAGGMAPSLDQAQYIDPQALLGIGGMQQEQLQKLINSGIYAGQYLQGQPENALATTLAQLLGVGGMGSTGTSTTTTQPSMLQYLLGGGSMLGSAGSGLGSMFSGLGSGLGSMFSGLGEGIGSFMPFMAAL